MYSIYCIGLTLILIKEKPCIVITDYLKSKKNLYSKVVLYI